MFTAACWGHIECQHWVWCCDPLMERKNISHGNCDAIDKKSWKAARRLFVKNFACEVWQSQRRLGYTSARLAPGVSVLNRGSGLMSVEMMSKCGVGCDCDILTLVSF